MWDEPGDKAEVSRDCHLPVRFTKGSFRVRGHFLFGSVCSVYAGTGELVQGHTIIIHSLAQTDGQWEMKKLAEL